MPTPVAIHGAAGRMGLRLVALAAADPTLTLAAAVVRPGHPRLGEDAGTAAGVGPVGVPLSAGLPDSFAAGCVVDFSGPAGTAAVLPVCAARGLAVVVATTGHDAAQVRGIERAAARVPVLLAPNTSLVVNLLFKLTKLTAEALAGKGFDIEIVERHHRQKKDAPSGTAAHFARICKEAMHIDRERHGREGLVGARPLDEIGVHAVRTGDNVGEHTLIFGAPGETLELVHKGTSRDSYARGALLAAAYLAGKPAGAYTMADVMGL